MGWVFDAGGLSLRMALGIWIRAFESCGHERYEVSEWFFKYLVFDSED